MKFWSTKIDNRKKDILVLVKGPTQGLEHTLGAEKVYSINFTKENTTFCWSLLYNGANSYLFGNGAEIIKFEAKDFEITPYELCWDWTVDYMKKTVIKGCVYDFSVDYDAIKVSDMLNIYKYLMENNWIV